MVSVLVVVFLGALCAVSAHETNENFPWDYQNISKLLISTAYDSDYPNFSYMCDTFGPRYRGTPNLQDALEWITETMINQGLENVKQEPVYNITNWVRGDESVTMLLPRFQKMAILGLGNSVGTPQEGITGEVFVVSSFDDLTANASQAQGKIILFNAPFVNYGETVLYRVNGASAAAKVGGIAALVRSITPFSLYTPHTGVMRYDPSVPTKIPTAAVTIEDAELMARFQSRGQSVVVTLKMQAQTKAPVTHYNILAEVEGSLYPEEVIVLGGHSDSWDVGTGCMDDGGGLFSSWSAVLLIHDLVEAGLIPRPKRTIRNVLWVDEEISGRGAVTYYQDHINEIPNHVAAMESDGGNFDTVGFGFTGTPAALQIISQIADLLSPIGAGNITQGGSDSDTGLLVQAGVPGLNLKSGGFYVNGGDAYYFFFHHTNADTFTAINMDGMRSSVAAFAIMSYVIADMDQRLPNGTSTYAK